MPVTIVGGGGGGGGGKAALRQPSKGSATNQGLSSKVYHVFNAQVIPPLSMSRRGNESLFYLSLLHTYSTKEDSVTKSTQIQ